MPGRVHSRLARAGFPEDRFGLPFAAQSSPFDSSKLTSVGPAARFAYREEQKEHVLSRFVGDRDRSHQPIARVGAVLSVVRPGRAAAARLPWLELGTDWGPRSFRV